MSKITIEIPTSSLDEIIALTKKLHGAVIDIEQQSTTSPLKYLKNISQNGGITSIKDASVWQNEIRTDKELPDRK
ncbi:MAG TPA: hypothetical protein PKV76_03310 [Chitinophagales bacterium]|jgi:hypothetical protein|nr:hypothetical protein [Chitinophagales bacterium]